jgi:hypothetical protein
MILSSQVDDIIFFDRAKVAELGKAYISEQINIRSNMLL